MPEAATDAIDTAHVHPASRHAPRVWAGAASGALVVFGFAVIHDLFIVDIWFNIGPMLFAGALCGATLVWAYNAAVVDHTSGRWFGYVAICGGLMVALGGLSLMVLSPRFTIAELTDNDDALALLLGPSWWLMVVAAGGGTVLLWWRYGRRSSAILPLLVSQSLLAFFVGHNFATLGLVEMSSQLLIGFAEFIGLTVFLGLGFAGALHVLTGVSSRTGRAPSG
ncbi:MAG: hypothetical protein R3343_09130 [Nitriliruptorales bacterium]|nr:hypothetical protein [Nitriliruptorales bacterium]